MIKKTGDLFTSDAPALAHGVNVKGVMGSGIAVLFKKAYPAMYDLYRHLCNTDKLLPGQAMVWTAPDGKVIYNAATQDNPGPNAKYEWLHDSLRACAYHAEQDGLDRIAIPLIGCGIGGLDWDEVEQILLDIEEEFETEFEVWTFE